MNVKNSINVIYLAASSRDARLTRICVASIRYFYPNIPIKILPGDKLQFGLAKELKKYWNVEVLNIYSADYGWGYVKMEPLFGPTGEKFLVMDVDTIFTGNVLSLWESCSAMFLVDNEKHTFEDYNRLYFNGDELKKIDPNVQTSNLSFSGGQWFGTAGVIKREDFDTWLEWSFPRRQKHSKFFFGGEQGIVSCVLTKKEFLKEISIDRTTIMRWPANAGALADLSLQKVINKEAGPLVIHWAGMKHIFLNKMVGSELLIYFENYYYINIRYKKIKLFIDNFIHVIIHFRYNIFLRLKLMLNKLN